MHLISVTNTLYYIYSLVQLEVLYTEIYSYFGIRVYFNSSDVQFFNDTISLITRILNDVELEIQALEIIISGSTTTTSFSSTTSRFSSVSSMQSSSRPTTPGMSSTPATTRPTSPQSSSSYSSNSNSHSSQFSSLSGQSRINSIIRKSSIFNISYHSTYCLNLLQTRCARNQPGKC